jgi:hypothetical protein
MELVRSWLRKGSHDLAAARLLGSSRPAILDDAAYHCQLADATAIVEQVLSLLPDDVHPAAEDV